MTKLDFSDPEVNMYFARMAIRAYLMAVVADSHMTMLQDMLYPEQKQRFAELRQRRMEGQYKHVLDELHALFGDLPPDILDILQKDA